MTNSKKIKRNIGASRRLAPFGHVRSITFTIMLLAVALIFGCRKSGGGGGITQTDPIRSLTGNLLIVSTDGKTNLNSLPLSFVGASATVTEVTEDPAKLNLDPTNFIIADGTLKLTNIDLSKTTDAAVSNKITLTFSLSGENLSRYTDTADIFVGKMQTNISVETLRKLKFDVSDTVKGQDSFDGDKLVQTEKGKAMSILFKNTDFKVDTSDDSKFTLENANTGNDGNQIKMSEIATILSNSFNSNQDISSYNNNAGFEITSSTEGTKATFVIKFKPFNSFYKEHSITFDQKKGAWIE